MLNIKQFTIKEITFIVVKINTVRTFLLIKKNEGNKKNKEKIELICKFSPSSQKKLLDKG